MSRRKANDDGTKDEVNSKKAFTVEDLDKMTEELTVDKDPTHQRLPNELLEQICEYMVPEFRLGTIPLGAPTINLPEDVLKGTLFPVPHLDGIIRASDLTRRMIGIAMLRRTTFTTRLDLSTRPTRNILPLTQLQNMPPIMRKNIRSIRVRVHFNGPATLHALEQYARIWYEPGLLRQRSGLRHREVEIVPLVNPENDAGYGFEDPNGDVFWIDGEEHAGEFIKDVRWVAESLVAEEKWKAARDPNFVIGTDLTELRERLQELLATPHCDEHFDYEDWSWKCSKCTQHELIEGWRMAAGVGSGDVHGAM
jgi:hypothetical protein